MKKRTFINIFSRLFTVFNIAIIITILGCNTISADCENITVVVDIATTTVKPAPEIHSIDLRTEEVDITPTPDMNTPELQEESDIDIYDEDYESDAPDIIEEELEVTTAPQPEKTETKTKRPEKTASQKPTPEPIDSDVPETVSTEESTSHNNTEISQIIDSEVDLPETSEELESSYIVVDTSDKDESTDNKFVYQQYSGDYSTDDLLLACKVAYLEAGNTDGRKAVLNVIYNRCISSKFGGGKTTIEEEVFRKSQFSVVNNSKFSDLTISDELLDYANDIFNNKHNVIPENVLFFRSSKKGNEWGNKVFYETIGGNSFFTSGD